MDRKGHSYETPNKESIESAQTNDPKEILKNLRLKNVNRLICAQLNINSIRNKFDSLVDIVNNNSDILMISENVNRLICAQLNINSTRNKFDSLVNIINNNTDILMISETKLDGQFYIHGFSEPYRFDRNGKAGEMLPYIREDIPLKSILTKRIEAFFVEIDLRKKEGPLLLI